MPAWEPMPTILATRNDEDGNGGMPAMPTRKQEDISPLHSWEELRGETPATVDDDYVLSEQILQNGLEYGIWIVYGITSPSRRIQLMETARQSVATLVRISGKELDEAAYAEAYTAILTSLANSYKDWKINSRPSTPAKRGGNLDVINLPNPIGNKLHSQERVRDAPPHMRVTEPDPALDLAISQMDRPRQLDETSQEFDRRRAAVRRIHDTSGEVPNPEGSLSYITEPTTAARPVGVGRAATLAENVSIVDMYPSPNRIPLLDAWEDRVNFQRVRNAELEQTGNTRIDDQGVHFRGHRPIGHRHSYFVGHAGDEPDPSDDDDDDEPDRGNNNNRPPNGPPCPPHRFPHNDGNDP